MKTKTLISYGLLLCLSSTCGPLAAADDDAVRSLSGIATVAVDVQIDVTEDAVRALLPTKSRIRRDAIDELEYVGIDVDASDNDATMKIFLRVRRLSPLSASHLSMRLETSILQPVSLTRDPDTTLNVETWRDVEFALPLQSNIELTIERFIEKQIDELSEAWQEANESS